MVVVVVVEVVEEVDQAGEVVVVVETVAEMEAETDLKEDNLDEVVVTLAVREDQAGVEATSYELCPFRFEIELFASTDVFIETRTRS